ncbi:cupin domain-containing protein [Acinetobacter sp. ME22]|uniref:cupin domain-containing protein n=1 Tax=Acinetobacter sp. ME22 TaxID=2904802 RepID=UPI001EDC6804|nr:cupin domain-containing protein [Acinetobacter sp. ME22]MCG2575108.1 cupin domain-containing protein [Acinetobacter sp. ME22]
MTTMTVVKRENIENNVLTPAGLREGADHGNPQLGIQSLAPEANGNLGIWECQPGGWPVIDRKDTEFCYIISGKATLTDERTGEKRDVTEGDLIILPVGWTGRWDVTETVRKIYTIY